MAGPNSRTWWCDSYLGAGFLLEDGKLLVGGRSSDNRSRIGELTWHGEAPEKFGVDFSSEPVLSAGPKGSFWRDGVSYPWLIGDQQTPSMLFVGWSRTSARFENHLGVAEFDHKTSTFRPRTRPLFPEQHLGTGSAASIDPEGSLLAVTVFDSWIQSSTKEIPRYTVWWCEKLRGTYSLVQPIEGLPVGPRQAVSKPNFLRVGEVIYAWFSLRTENAYRIIGGIIEDGKFSAMPHLDIDPRGTGWESDSTEYFHARISEGQIIGIYNGNCFGKTGIGLARSSILAISSSAK